MSARTRRSLSGRAQCARSTASFQMHRARVRARVLALFAEHCSSRRRLLLHVCAAWRCRRRRCEGGSGSAASIEVESTEVESTEVAAAAQCRSCRRRRRRAHRRCSPPALQSHLLRADLLSSTVFSKTGQANFFRRKSVGAAFDSFHRASKVKFFDLPPVKEKGCHKI